MDDDVWRAFRSAGFVAGEVVVRGKSIEDLARIGKVGLQSEDAGLWVWKVDEVEIEDLSLR